MSWLVSTIRAMTSIAITHSTQENPVSGGGTDQLPPRWEEQLTEPIADHAAWLLQQAGHVARSDWPHSTVGDVIRAVNAWGADIVIDIHTDAFNGAARGTSVFWYPGSERGERLGRLVGDRVSAVSGKLRGAYPRGDLGITRLTNGVGVLVELDFHDNQGSATDVWAQRYRYGAAIAEAVTSYLGAPSVPQPAPAPVQAPQRRMLVVDGIRGPATNRRMQEWLGVAQDGIVGRNTIKALQRRVGATQDGILGPQTVAALQRIVGARVDGDWGPATTRALQAYLNRQP